MKVLIALLKYLNLYPVKHQLYCYGIHEAQAYAYFKSGKFLRYTYPMMFHPNGEIAILKDGTIKTTIVYEGLEDKELSLLERYWFKRLINLKYGKDESAEYIQG